MQFSTYDLHCHSNMSDGELCPEELVRRAKRNGVEVLSLTDHDTLAGLELAAATAVQEGIELVPGIELSCQWNGHTIHVLGLNFSLEHSSLWDAQVYQTKVRETRSEIIAERLQKKGMPDVLGLARKNAKSGVPGRPHFAQAMVEMELVKNHQEAFKKFLGSGKIGDVKSGWPELAEVIQWITLAGGCAVLAHPRKYSMSLTKLRALIEEFRGCGGQGIEVVMSGQKQGEIGLLSDLCHRFEMAASVGSDFHSTRFPWADLGRVAKLPSTVTPIWELWG